MLELIFHVQLDEFGSHTLMKYYDKTVPANSDFLTKLLLLAMLSL